MWIGKLGHVFVSGNQLLRKREKGARGVLARKKGMDGLFHFEKTKERVMWWRLMRCFAFKGTCGPHTPRDGPMVSLSL